MSFCVTQVSEEQLTQNAVVIRINFFGTLGTHRAVRVWHPGGIVRTSVRGHDGRSPGGEELTAIAAWTGAVIGIFQFDAEVRHGCDRVFWKIGIVVKWTHGATASTLQDGEHKGRDLEAPAKRV